MMILLAVLALSAPDANPVPAPPEQPDQHEQRDQPDQRIQFAQVTIRIERNSIVRVPAPPFAVRRSVPVRWREKSAPNCIRWTNMAAAMVSSPTTVDIIIRGGARYRVKLEKSCSAVDFYSGFYVKVTPDGQICKDRDMIHSRAGGQCAIDKFRTLVADK